MSKEQAIRFMLLTERDEELKRKFKGIVNKYERKNLTEEEQGKFLLEEVMPLGKSLGFEFCTEDFQELMKLAKKQLTDEELNKVVGGRGQYHRPEYGVTHSCELVSDDETFRRYFEAFPHNNCPNFEFIGCGGLRGQCLCCKHFNLRY